MSLGDRHTPGMGNGGYNVGTYDIRTRFDFEHQVITATAWITATSTLDRLGRISLDFSGYDITRLDVDGRPASYRREGAELLVRLPQLVDVGVSFGVRVDYHGSPEPLPSRHLPGNLKLGLNMRSDHAFVVSEPDGAHAWFPCNDHPSDKATFRFEVTVPAGYEVAANGRIVAESATPEGRTVVLHMDQPMATYLATVNVARYSVIEESGPSGLPIRHYLLDAYRPESLLGVTAQALSYFSELIGPYPFDTYGHAEADVDGVAALETQSMVVMLRGLLADPGYGHDVLVHEAAHQWFGDAVSLASWSDIWLNEGFATYLAAMWSADRGQATLKETMAWYESTLVTSRDDSPLSDPHWLFGSNSYKKGAWVLHMLRHLIDEDDFSATLHLYFSRHNGGNVTTADFKTAAEEVSGLDLSPFFGQWVYGGGMPRLDVSWVEQRSGSDWQVTVQVCQTQERLFELPLKLVVRGDLAGGRSLDQTVTVDQRSEHFALAVPFDPESVEVDPNQVVLAGVTVEEVASLPACRVTGQ
jgi:aminopeptidase N